MRNFLKVCAWGMAAVGLALMGCQPGPKLTKDKALALIQVEYDHQPPVNAIILVNDAGMKEGVMAHYWDRTKAYPNRVWADFKLTDEGKKYVTLTSGGDTILWHPGSATDARYRITLSPVLANHLKATDASDLVKGANGSRQMVFEEVTSLQGVPDPIQQMARESHTRLATPRRATFVLQNGDWKLESVQ